MLLRLAASQRALAVGLIAVLGIAIKVIIALFVAAVIFRLGISMLRALSTPLPEPPPPGELRKVDLHYRCSVCGAEARITRASEELPPPPRHCQDEMDLVAPID